MGALDAALDVDVLHHHIEGDIIAAQGSTLMSYTLDAGDDAVNG